MNNNYNSILQKISEIMNSKGWSLYKLAKESGIAYSSLLNMFNRNTIPSILSLERICTGLGITLSEFFKEDNVNDLSEHVNLNDNQFQFMRKYLELPKESQKLATAFIEMLLNNQQSQK